MKALTIALCGAAWLLATAPIGAQTRSSITGIVTDPSAAILPGVTVTLTSPDLVGGAQTTVTGQDGAYRFSDLPPGVYDVHAQLSGFQSFDRSELRLLFGTTLTVDFVLAVGSVTERMVVVGRAPAVDVTTARSTSKIDEHLILATPTVTDQRNGLEIMAMSPGVNLRSALGAARDANEVLLDGSPATAPERQATNAAVINSDWMEEIQVVAVGANAEYGEFSGAVVNFVLRGGSNEKHGLLEYRKVPGSWIGNNVGNLSAALQTRFTGTTILTQWDANAQMGGPIVQDRLFYFGGFQKIRNDTIAAGAPLTPGPTTQSQWRALGKLTWAAANNVRVEGSVQSNKVRLEGNGSGTATPETGSVNSEPNTLVSTRATWTANAKTLVEVRVGGLRYEQSIDPKTGGRTGAPPHRDTITGISSVNLASYRFLHETRFGFGGSVTRYEDHALGQHHELKAGVDVNRIGFYSESGFPGGLSFVDRSGQPDQVTIWAGDTISASGTRTTFYVQDAWRITDRVRLEPGLRVSFNRGSTPTAGSVYSTTPIDPRLGLAWDVSKDHKTVVRAHYGRYHEAFGTTEYQFTDTATQTVQITARVNAPGNYTELTRLTPANNLLVDSNIKQAYMDQYMVGIERELFTDFSLSAQYIQRNSDDQFNWLDTKSIYTPVSVQDPGKDNVLGTADDGAFFTAYNLTNPGVGNRVFANIGSRRYRGLQLVAQKRYSKNWQVLAGYTRSRAEGSVNNQILDNYGGTAANNPFLSPNNAINSVGRNTLDPPHQLLLRGSYRFDVLGGFNVGPSYRYISGNAMSRTAVFRLTQGNTTIRVEPRGTFPTEATNSVDVRFDKTFPLGTKARLLSIYLDVFNLNNQGVATGAAAPNTEASGATYGVPTAWATPRTFLISGRLTF
jgi:carboxypeptidase family protein